MTKVHCYMCGETNPEKFFSDKSRSNGVSSRCKQCCRKQTRDKMAFRQAFLDHLRSRGCAICGETDRAVVEFHHANPKDRSFSVAGIGHRRGWGVYFDEVAKCILLCANCHKRSHFYKWKLDEVHQFDRQKVEEEFNLIWALEKGREAP